jgi:hypothetical protein
MNAEIFQPAGVSTIRMAIVQSDLYYAYCLMHRWHSDFYDNFRSAEESLVDHFKTHARDLA